MAVRPRAAQKPCRDLFSLGNEAIDRFDDALAAINYGYTFFHELL